MRVKPKAYHCSLEISFIHNYVPTDIQNSPLTRAQHTQVPVLDKANQNSGRVSNEVTLLDPTSH